MMGMDIPDEAVEVAAKVILHGIDEGHHAYKIAYAALEAAAPYLMAQAWDEGTRFVDEHIEVPYGWGDYPNPYRSQA